MINKWYYRLGTVFFFAATIYLLILCWKAYIWANWLERLNDTFN